MKRLSVFLIFIILISATGVVAAEEFNDSSNLNEVFKMADDMSPGIYEEWEAVRNYRENLKDEIIKKRRKCWMESAEDREAMKESIDLEKDFLLNQYNEGILTNEEYSQKLRELGDDQKREMVRRNQEWIDEIRRDKKEIEEHKYQMKSNFSNIMQGIKNNNKLKVQQSFNDFIKAYEKTTDMLQDKLKRLEE